MIALSTAVEPLRMANKITGQSVYDWSIVSLDGQPTPASNGLQLSPTAPLEQLGPVDILFVCGGVEVQEAVTPKILAVLRRLAERRVPLGALCTGGYALAKAGLLDKYRATIHWENLSALREEFPRIHLSDQLFTIDRDRFTCSGGVAPLDLMLHLVESKLGAPVSQLISEQFIVDRVRNDRDRQYVPLRAQIGVSHESLIKVAQLMEENIEKPLSLDEIASATGLSRRQIERLFKRHLNCVPKRYYLQMRLSSISPGPLAALRLDQEPAASKRTSRPLLPARSTNRFGIQCRPWRVASWVAGSLRSRRSKPARTFIWCWKTLVDAWAAPGARPTRR